MPYAVYFCGEFERLENSRPILNDGCDTIDFERVEGSEVAFELWAQTGACYKDFPYMVKTYEDSGHLKGMTKEKVYFQNLEDAKRFFVSRFEYRKFSYNPTMWEKVDNRWSRICGF